MVKKYEIEFAGRPLIVETGLMAKQAHGSCTVRYGDTVVLITACRGDENKDGGFMPLTVNYLEMTYAAGRIPGGFFKREGRPTEKEVLSSRLIDRPLRPLFPDGYSAETQVVATCMSVDEENDPEIIALTGASIALGISDIPFSGPISGVRVGKVNGELICNPTQAEQAESTLDIIVAGGDGGMSMVEGGAEFASEDEVLEALFFAQEAMKPVIDLQHKIIDEIGKGKLAVTPHVADTAVIYKVKADYHDRLTEALAIPDKISRYAAIGDLKAEVLEALNETFEGNERDIKAAFDDMKSDIMRTTIISEKKRVDGRGTTDVRDISCATGTLPRTHGSSLFTRGETQALVVATLGTSDDEQRIDSLAGMKTKRFMLHYNFLPFCVGEARFLKSPGRREIGHGALAERAITKVLPGEDFPYTMRIVSEIMESNGSSSMASVCGASLALMDAGVPTKGHVAGIAMGLIKEGDDIAILSDILGDEDHIGDMDFKVAGTEEGITAVQMDIKITGVTAEIMKAALYQAREGRLHILKEMNTSITEPREELSAYAPRIITMNVSVDKIKDVIGPGGKIIRGIVAETGVKMDIDDSGKINIASTDEEMAKKAIEMVKNITQEAEVGRIYLGKVMKIMDFGAFVQIFPGTEGLVHISQLAEERVNDVRDIVSEGDEFPVEVLEIDRAGKIRLSRKSALGKEVDPA